MIRTSYILSAALVAALAAPLAGQDPEAQESAVQTLNNRLFVAGGAPPQGEALRLYVDQAQAVNELSFENRALGLFFREKLVAGNPLGIEVAPVEPPLRVHLRLPADEGVIVTSAPPESEGAKAGLRQNDLILKVVDSPVADAAQFVQALEKQAGEKPVQQPLRLKVVREGKHLEIQAVPQRVRVVRAISAPRAGWTARLEVEERYLIGVTLADVDDTLRAHLKLPEGQGLVVTEVIPDSPAAQAGVEANDILLSLDGQPLTTVEKINAQVQEIQDRTVTLKLLRAGEEKSVAITPRKNKHQADDHRGALALIANACPVQSFNCQSCHQGHASGASRYWLQANGVYDLLVPQLLIGRGENAPPAGSAAEQLTRLKQQLEQMQATIAALESLMVQPPEAPSGDKSSPPAEQPPTENAPAEQPPAEKPPSER